MLKLEAPDGAKEILLHACCAPCSGAVLECLRDNGIRPVVFFSNSNIFPRAEYDLRLSELQRYAAVMGVELVADEYDHDAWLAAVRGLEREPERGERCAVCFRFRLARAARYAASRGLPVLATTLASSRWKDLDQVNAAGASVCEVETAAAPENRSHPRLRKREGPASEGSGRGPAQPDVSGGSLPWSEAINVQTVRAYEVYLLDERKEGAKTVNLHLSVLSGFCKFLMKEGVLESNPVRLVSRPKQEKRLPVFYREDAMRTYFEQTKGVLEFGKYEDQLQRMILGMLFATGLRRAELISLNRESVDLARRVLRVRGKGDKMREIPPPP
ncbi:MAG: epoxyqueuosine reductase QueH, partial [Bacteroidales bacterium]|nr:epoxyqueuosine reductase QueH [Bacteroidales bacterium]